ncbi:MAG: hypothetical protein HYU97_11540 [Deltaproteobacteria bacterium]|nr:hypothetical protein [Deltaproteobacteria bacterium]
MKRMKILGSMLIVGAFVSGLLIALPAKAQSLCTSACASPSPSYPPTYTPTPIPTPTPTGTITTTPTPTPTTPPAVTPTPPAPTPTTPAEPTPPQTATSATSSIPLVIEGRSCSLSTALVLPLGSVLGYASLLGFSILGLISFRKRR